MDNSALHPFSVSKIKLIVFDIVALAAIYLVPPISHLFNFPVYYLEPMRIMLILAISHTSRKNAYLIALTLPVFSFLISAHPSLIKTTLITSELLLNVWLFFFLSERLSNKMFGMMVSVVLSKIFYYLIKYLLISSAFMSGNLISTPIYFQLVVIIILSVYIYLFSKKNTIG
ncbi:MAG: hypothetical protein IPM14_07225 [bacterium]|nr:hypothetical protein [bacterium]